MTAEEVLEALFPNVYTDFNSNSFFNDIHENDSDSSINSNYNEISSSQHIHESIISQMDTQEIDKVNVSANAQEFSVAVDTQINSHPSIQYDRSVYVCDIEMGADVPHLEESTFSVPGMGNEPVTNISLNEETNENEINNRIETVNSPLPVKMQNLTYLMYM